MSYVLAGASLSKLVLAHDHHDTDLETLGDLYLNRSEDHIPDALRWFYCVGLGIALLCMSKSFILPPLPLLTSLFFTKLTTPTSLDLYIPHPQRNPGPTHCQTLPPRRPRLDIPHPLLPTPRTRPQLPQTSRHHHGLNRLSPGRWSLRININEWFVLAWWECVQVFRRLFGEEEGHWDGAEERGEDSGWGVGERGDWRKVLFWVGGWKEEIYRIGVDISCSILSFTVKECKFLMMMMMMMSLHIPSSHRIASPFTLTLYTRKEENQGIIWSNYQILNANLSSRESIICYVKSRERAGSTSASDGLLTCGLNKDYVLFFFF